MNGQARPFAAAGLALGLLVAGPQALAAPTCLDAAARTIRCGAPGAMPVGWTPSPDQRAAADQSVAIDEPPQPSAGFVASVALLLFALFALFGLLPDFDGWRDGDWDRQEGDGERRS